MSKHTAVFVFDEEHKTIVIESVDGVRYVPAVEENPYQKYVGKWLRYALQYEEFNKWFYVVSCQDCNACTQTRTSFTINDFEGKKEHEINVNCFDLTDPRDSNPDEIKKADNGMDRELTLKNMVNEKLTKFIPDEKPTVTTAHSSLVIREDKRPHDHLVGKWYKKYNPSGSFEWVEIVCIDYNEDENDPEVDFSNGVYTMYSKMDLRNLRDYKPHPIPAEIREGLMLLPTDHPEYGNIRKEVIEIAEKYGPGEWLQSTNRIANAIGWITYCIPSPSSCLMKYFDLAKSGAFDPKPVEERIPFNIKEWQRREYLRIETRSGKRVSHLNNMEATNYPLVGLVEGHTLMNFWNLEGNHSEILDDCALDLFLVINKQK